MSKFSTGHHSVDAVTGGIGAGEFEIRIAATGHGLLSNSYTLVPALASGGIVGFVLTEEDSLDKVHACGLHNWGANAGVADKVLVHGTDSLADVTSMYFQVVDRHLSFGSPIAAVVVDAVELLLGVSWSFGPSRRVTFRSLSSVMPASRR